VNAIIYPIQFLRRLNGRWAAQIERLTDRRRSRSSGTDRCVCGQDVVAPRRSSYSATAVVNEWHCASCGRIWKTYAEVTGPEGAPS
jgi:hypothetical protein